MTDIRRAPSGDVISGSVPSPPYVPGDFVAALSTVELGMVAPPFPSALPAQRLLGRGDTGAGAVQELTVGASFGWVGVQLQRAALTGDVAAAQDSNATLIQPAVVSNSKLADMAQGLRGRSAAGTGVGNDITLGSEFSFSGSSLILGSNAVPLSRLVNASGGSRLIGRNSGGGGSWQEATLASSLQMTAGAVLGVAPNGISNTELAQMAAATLKGNPTGGTANPTDLSLGNGLEFATGALRVTQMAANTFKGNNTGSTGSPLDLTIAQTLAALGLTKGFGQFACACRSAGGQSFTAASGFQTVTAWDTELFDSGGMHSTGVNPARFTIPSGAAGTYVVFWTWNASQNGVCQLRLNGATSLQDRPSLSSETAIGFIVVTLAVADFIELRFDIAVDGTMTTSPVTACTYGIFSLNIP